MTLRDITTQTELRKVKQQNKMSEMMISNVTHEYLTPMRCINNLSTMLQQNCAQEQYRSLTIIARTSTLLLSQINMTLDGNLIERKNFRPAYTIENLKFLVQDTVDLLSSQADIKNVKMQVSCHIEQEQCQLDKMRLQQVLINLLSNAIKFSHKQSFIFITVQTVKSSENELEVLISVKDQGIGMNQSDLANLFTPYFQSTC